MSSKCIDLTGKRYGRLVVEKSLGKNEKGKYTWLCKCDCGNEKIVQTSYLRSGHTTSCGCYHNEMVGKLNRKHNLSNKCGRLYFLWKSIKYRCYCENSKDFHNYGGRGISMCDEWKKDFSTFYEWAINNGYKEEKTAKGLNVLTIDRIDVNGNYEPSNCRFVTNKMQAKNKRNTMKDFERYRTCPICGNKFEVSQRSCPNICCSVSCGQKLRRKKSRNEL